MSKRPIIFHLADSSMERGLKAFFGRDDWHFALKAGPFEIDPEEDFFQDPNHTDGGVWKHAHINLRPYIESHEKAVIVLDEDFDPYPSADQIREDITQNMLREGWTEDRFEVVVIEPMLEAWLWADNLNVAQAFGCNSFEQLQQPLINKGLWVPGEAKPNRGDLKKAKTVALKLGKTKLSGSPFPKLFRLLSSRALDSCQEPSFQQMRAKLQAWFPLQTGGAA
ncbi:hypothetical protein AAFN60_18570 [Roseibacillus persicicus]|uniref:methylation-associated defense system protein MAD4 n=1 Tax=Roseibacillus persicicus TaxID=454148 RepID=UPI00398A64D3